MHKKAFILMPGSIADFFQLSGQILDIWANIRLVMLAISYAGYWIRYQSGYPVYSKSNTKALAETD